ncbi:hypothetical protein MS3_00006938 [Schistosoma haematobium]|uniref:Uncharacterized protein n=4 Tax=Schistosoma TaxID=6181 RepID=A0A922IS54_SCHHA|nr:hypothetical protein MS3_00006938 [Schistosoma haematobium]KAH9585795.1 hypothetical protein MS3_00006938 [Schistosoma haematobium]
MVWLIRRKDGVSPIFPLRGCFCLDNRLGCFISTITTAISSAISWVFVVLDLVTWAIPDFVIDPQFPTYWRIRFWKGFILCDIFMFFANLILLIMSVIVIVAISWPARYRLYHLKSYLRAWCIIMVLYQIANLGVGVYTYSWYGLAAWVGFLIVGYSYYSEIKLALVGEGDPEVLQEINFLSGAASTMSPHIYTFPQNQKI